MYLENGERWSGTWSPRWFHSCSRLIFAPPDKVDIIWASLGGKSCRCDQMLNIEHRLSLEKLPLLRAHWVAHALHLPRFQHAPKMKHQTINMSCVSICQMYTIETMSLRFVVFDIFSGWSFRLVQLFFRSWKYSFGSMGWTSWVSNLTYILP